MTVGIRSVRKAFVTILSTAVILSGMLSAPVSAQSERSAKVFSATGSVSVKRGGDKLLPAFEGMRLEQGDIIIAAADSSAVIEIDGDKTVSVDESTEIALSTLVGTAENSQTGISLFFGNIVNSIQNKLTKGSTFETETPTAIMGVRGTTYLVGLPMDGNPSVLVSSGSVQTDTQKGTTTVETGYIYDAMADAPETLSAERLVSFGPMAVSALANDDLLQRLSAGGDKVSLPALVAAAAEHRARQKAAASQVAQGAGDTAQEYFFDAPGAKLTGPAGIPAAAAAPQNAEEAETDLTPEETVPASQEQQTALSGTTPATGTSATTGTLNGGKDPETGKTQKDTGGKNLSLPSYSDAYKSSESDSGSGGSGDDSGYNPPDHVKPVVLPRELAVTGLTVEHGGDGAFISWYSAAAPEQQLVTLIARDGSESSPEEISREILDEGGTLYGFEIESANLGNYQRVRVVVKGDGVRTRDSEPQYLSFLEVSDSGQSNNSNSNNGGGGDDGQPGTASIQNLSVSKLNDSSVYVISWDKVEDAASYDVEFTKIDDSTEKATEIDFTTPQAKITVSADKMTGYKCVTVSAKDSSDQVLAGPANLNLTASDQISLDTQSSADGQPADTENAAETGGTESPEVSQ